MKNGDLPAMPVDVGALYESRTDKGSWELASLGLTKREQFAMAAMQGLLSNEQAYQRGVKFQNDMPLSRQAVNMADALLAELERTK